MLLRRYVIVATTKAVVHSDKSREAGRLVLLYSSIDSNVDSPIP